MIISPTPISGVFILSPEPMVDERGSFARLFCSDEMKRAGLASEFPQISLSRNTLRGTLRGMHFQAEPFAETKLVRCVSGRIFDVAIDLRPESMTQGQWFACELDAGDGRSLYIPEGVAHGFQTLEDNCDVLYQITPSFVPGRGQGVRWNDPAFGIAWPTDVTVISDRDAVYEDWRL